MTHIQVNGKRAFYASPHDVAGGDRRGKTVLLVHGARSNHRIWAPQLQALAPWHTPIAMDLPGHGGSEGSGSTNVSEYRDFVKALVDALGLESFVIAGHSMGGSIALDFTLNYPGVEAYIPVGSAPQWNIDSDYIDIYRTDPERAVRESAGRNFSKSTPRAIVELNEWNNKSTPIAVGIGDLEACNAFNQAPHLGDVKVPTCVICGEEDLYVDGSPGPPRWDIGFSGALDKKRRPRPIHRATPRHQQDNSGLPGIPFVGESALCIGQMTSHPHMLRFTLVP